MLEADYIKDLEVTNNMLQDIIHDMTSKCEKADKAEEELINLRDEISYILNQDEEANPKVSGGVQNMLQSVLKRLEKILDVE